MAVTSWLRSLDWRGALRTVAIVLGTVGLGLAYARLVLWWCAR